MNNKIKFEYFNDLNLENINIEFQVHTTQTDGRASIEEMLKAAVKNNIDKLAFTEHVRNETTWFPEFKNEVLQKVKEFDAVEVLVGCETKILDLDGRLDVTKQILEDCDIVLGSVHSFPKKLMDGVSMGELKPEVFAEIEFNLALSLIKHSPIDVLAHPGGMYEKTFKKPFPISYYEELIIEAIKHNVAIEINSTYLLDFSGFLKLCEKYNPKVSIGSDAHDIYEVGNCRNNIKKMLF